MTFKIKLKNRFHLGDFLGTDGSIHGAAGSRNINGDGLYVDAAVELLSSDLRVIFLFLHLQPLKFFLFADVA